MKDKILIGPVNPNDLGSIPTLNRAFMIGLSKKFEFIPFNVTRKYGKSEVSNFNIINLSYLVKQFFLLIIQLLIKRPIIFHYAITSNWNFEKSMLFLKTAKLLGAKRTIGHLHGGSFDVFIKGLKGNRKKRALRLLNSIDAIIVASDYWKVFLKGINVKTKIEVVNNPIDLLYVSKIKKIQKNEEVRNNRFLFVGSLGQRKGFYDIIEASKLQESNYLLDAVGSEDRKNDLNIINQLISQNNLSSRINIIVSEKMNIDDKVKYFSLNSVFLFPSHNENFPLVIIEAACAGMAIISTRVGAIPEFFTHMKNIYFIEPGSIEQINEAINFMIQNPKERQNLGNSAKNLYDKRLSEKIIMDQLDQVYCQVLK